MSLALLACASAIGCAEGGETTLVPRDVGALDTMRRDGGDAALPDAGPTLDTLVDADAPMGDGGRGSAAQCEACTVDSDCLPAHYCADLTGGDRVCLRACDIDLAECGDDFDCVASFTMSIPEPVCAPVGMTCCVDGDGDLYGTGVGCEGLDCDDADPLIHGGATETCDGIDQDCDTMVDEGDPAVLCVGATHVATTICTSGACAIDSCEPNFDDCNTDATDGCEADLLTTTDCLSCGAACNLPNVETYACAPGGCTIVTCVADWGDCDGLPSNGCEQSLTTSSHCGGCGLVCGASNATSTCATGTCAIETCDRNWGDCDGVVTNGCEVPLVTDTDCGTCGTICAPAGGTGSCTTGTCRVTTCASGFEDCNMSTADGCETSIRTLTNCGACGVPCSFANGTASCAVGACTLSECLAGFGNCDGLTSNGCETTLNTLLSCGACGVACAPANGMGTCSTGTCAIQTCNAGFADCDGLVSNGCETSLRTATDCGSCGTVCSRAGATATCATGTCALSSCNPGVGNCDGNDVNGCETSLTTTSNCVMCGVACGRANATASCGGGACAIQSCNAGFQNCDGVDSNGCETPLTGLSSCGGCGVVCTRANASADCSSGTCRIDFCSAGFANCDGIDGNGCETSLSTLANCGGCGAPCSLPNAAEMCSSGVCQITTCSSGYDDCDSTDSNGCEVSLRSLTDCGGCGVPCSRSGATATCATGMCSILSCNPGSGNCDGSDMNGCEATLDSLTNCGGCGVACARDNATETCPGGTCTLGTCAAGFGNCDGSATNGCESSLTTLTNCGTCGTACNLPNGTETCSTGTCEVLSCSAAFDDCNGTAADGCERSIRSVTDCGACGVPCTRAGATPTCATGSCAILSCSAGFGNCDGVDGNGCETSLSTLTNCGTCGTTCSLPNATETCSSGTCALGVCAAGFGDCNGVVADGCETALNSLTNCGACGMVCDLAGSGESCATGTCLSTGCAAGLGDCDAMPGCETSLTTLTNCGGCGTVCGLANATESCSTGTCAITMCDAGFGNCDGLVGTGCEAPLSTLTNCGTCGTACSLTNATESCSTGTCAVTSCDAGFGNCNGTMSDGCEAPLTSLANCAMCGAACNLTNANESCATGSCEVTSCLMGFGNCDGVASNGCEVNTQTSLGNCGSCGTVCSPANATGVCSGGGCGVASCDAGWGNCNGVAADGCETPLNTLTNCASCGTACDFPNSTESCASGTCTFGTCAAGYGNCDMMTANGCETPLNTVSNCAACGMSCDLLNAAESCATGSCGITTCNALYGNCDGLTATGCETPLTTTTNCGACGGACTRVNATATCAAGTCGIGSCDTNFGNCDGIDMNGCEASLTTLTSCGSCGVACAPANATGTCSSGACAIQSCDAGFANCDGLVSNGCETPLNTLTNCGSCGTACTRTGGTATCATGTCSISTCNPGVGNCDGNDVNGCETSLTTTTNCAGCGTTCTRANATATCGGGACAILSCNAGFANCDGIDANGCETALTGLSSCGGCGVVCARANASAECSTGTCRISFCNSGYANCDAVDGNGCETSLSTLTNCGACGAPCALPNAAETCGSGVCQITSCSSGYDDCDGLDPNGCEISLRTLTDCGGCGVPCSRPGATATCATGSCSIMSCNAGTGNCDGTDMNGCEASLSTLSNCGGCGVGCALDNATETCPGGVCTLGTCSSGFGNCDGTSSNGCETSLTTLTNCGTCGTGCNLANATESCSTGTCDIVTCSAGFEDCNGIASDGCERNIRTTTDCGGCGVPCSRAGATATCATGSCSILSCNAGSGNCDAVDGNGCETSLYTLTSCGACATPCDLPNATETCPTGTCTLGTCSGGFGNCDGTSSNGCETSLTTLTNCATCGTACALANATESCATGACAITACSAGFANCNGTVSDGCERATTTLTDCGACGVPCSRAGATATCASGSCSIMSCNAGSGNCDAVDSNGCETPLNTLTNCAGCGVACNLPNATESCATGTCALGTCAAGYGNCNGVVSDGCETPLNTLTNCASCGTICDIPAASESCATGTCMLSSCAAGTGDCDGNAVNGCETPLNTLTNCGGCGTTCSLTNATESCSTGSCVITSCDAGFGNCDAITGTGCEAPLNTLTNCATCGTACALANAAESCSTGSCTLGACDAGFGNCNATASDGCEAPLTSLSNCATCGTTCNLANASESCATGTCEVTTCSANFGNCNGTASDGCEIATNTLTNCGTCGTACSLANATESCSSGSCAITTCDANFANCNGTTADGCETATNTLTNCATCGTACNLANATESCSTGACVITTCSAGFGNCNGTTADGCELALTSLTNCGTCGTVCNLANASESCATGTCEVTTCSAGFGNCDGTASNGCEAPLTTTTNCGACGTACSPANATGTCSTGSCAVSTCNAGWGNCNGLASDGCETPLNTLTNCASCGTTCDFANATESCSTGTCTFGTCSAGFGNCDAMTANGCETSLSTLANCAMCGVTCNLANATESCSTGACGITMCDPLFGNCDGMTPNGCETPLTTTANCATCGVTCTRANAAATCSTGSCGISTCNANFGNCDANDANGCETNHTNTVTACGNCATNCASPLPANTTTTSCASSACTITACSAGYFNTDMAFSNGCECLADSHGDTCAAPTNMGTVTDAGSVNRSGNLVGGTDEDWFTVTLTPAATCGFLPTVTISNGGLPIAFQVYTGCSGSTPSGSMACTLEGGTSNGNNTTWEFRNSLGACGDLLAIDPTPAVGTFYQGPLTLFIRVLRTASSTSCLPYTITVSA